MLISMALTMDLRCALSLSYAYAENAIPPPDCAISHLRIGKRQLVSAVFKPRDAAMKTVFHALFAVAFVLGLVSSVLANVH